ncbi:MAG: four helix bundle protein [Chitinophagales bacterium]
MEHNFKKLKIWNAAMDIVDEVFALTSKFPKEEIFCLQSQSRRAAIAMPSNVAEGSGRRTKKDFSNFIDIALGSSNELVTQLIIAERRKYILNAECESLASKIQQWQNMTVSFQNNNLKV